MSAVTLLAGLGNPGPAYVNTRHNLGFHVLDLLAEAEGLSWRRERRWEAEIATWRPAEARSILLVKPQTFMNASGSSLQRLSSFHRIAPGSIAVLADEVQLPVGRIKLGLGGGAGGHNGLGDIIQKLGAAFWRLRLGVGPLEPWPGSLRDFVLGKFTAAEQTVLAACNSGYLRALRLLVDAGPAAAMNDLNQRIPLHDRNLA